MCIRDRVGGPISSAAYVVGLQMAGSIVIPISALCPAIGAILGRILYKQELNKRMVAGIVICVLSSFMIGSTSLGGDAPEGRLLGICIAFIAALGWGIEGCVAGYGTTLIDYEIGITIRQCTSGLSNLCILVPIFGIIAGNIGIAPVSYTHLDVYKRQGDHNDRFFRAPYAGRRRDSGGRCGSGNY